MQDMDIAMYNLFKHKWHGNLYFLAPTHVNTNTTHTKGARRRVEGHEIAPKYSEVYGKGILNHQEL
jgi:hypothetical protein